MNDSYHGAFARIKNTLDSVQWSKVMKLFKWMTYSKRPLKWHELQAVMAMTEGCHGFDFENKQLLAYVTDLCESLVHVVAGDRIEFAHSSVKK